jgi:tRNA modification GTPase
VAELASAFLPGESAVALNRRQAAHISEASDALRVLPAVDDPVLLAEQFRTARAAFDQLTGRAGIEDVLDALFSRFCLGK